MAKVTDTLEPGDLAKLKGLQYFARSVVEGFCSGLHTSPHKGFSVEFKQHRPYTRGDEIRRIDWKVFGRSDKYFIREYEEETNLRATIVLDCSGSMKYTGSAGIVKFEYARRVAASLAYLLMTQADSVGLALFDTKIRDFIPNRSRITHLKVLMDAMQAAQPGEETDLGTCLQNIVPRMKRRGVVILVSDCFGSVDSLTRALAHFRHRGHEVLVFQIWDRDELDFPFKQWTQFVNLENEALLKMVDPAVIRASYMKRLADFRRDLKDSCRKNRVDLIEMTTDQPYAEALSRYMNLRMR